MAAAVTMSACCNCGKKTANTITALTEGEWQLMQLDGHAFKAEDDRFTLSFTADNKVAGKGDCNRMHGSYEVNLIQGTLSFAPLASTRMMCPNQADEDRYMRMFDKIDAYKIDGKMLLLFSDGEVKMMFERKR